MAQMNLLVVTPETTLLDCPAEAVMVPLFDGSKGILPGHAPMIGRLGPGILRVQRSADTKKYFIEGGFVQVDHNVVSVLTNVAMPLESLKTEVLETRLADLKAHNPQDPAEKLAHQRNLVQTRAMLQASRSLD